MAGSSEQVMMTGTDTSPRIIKLEGGDSGLGLSTLPSSSSYQSAPSQPKVLTVGGGLTLQADQVIKRLVQTADGQYMILATNGNTPFLQPIVTSQSLPRVVGEGASPRIVVKHVGSGDPIKTESVDSFSVSDHSSGASVVDTKEHISVDTVAGQKQLEIGDLMSAISGQVTRQLAEKQSADAPAILLPSDAIQTEVEVTGSSNSQPHILSALAQDTIIQTTPSTSKNPLIRRVKFIKSNALPNILKRSVASPVFVTGEQLQLAQGLTLPGSIVTSQALPGSIVTSQVVTSHVNGEGLSEAALQSDSAPQLFIQQVDEATVETVSTSQVGSSQSQFLLPENRAPCPICADKISGYHYGIFTCESCKGFFKRTVQNKKAFICHRKGECDINIVQRKKCPACRFKRCLLAGMKLEAVREDRQRGGRSSYDGANNYARSRQSLGNTPPRPRVVVKRPAPQVKRTIMVPTDQGNQIITMVYPDGSQADVTVASQEKAVQLQPHTPPLLEDLMAVESLMSEDDAEQDCCRGKFVEGDDSLFLSLLHFADHCLYKIVRWARNLPDFASVSTDDQILLLQNCWGELLCLCCCWNSIHCDQEIKVAAGRALNIQIATLLGIDDLVSRMLEYVSSLRQLELDSHEFIALKTLLLLNPDVKNLRDHRIIRAHQERVAGAFMIYSATHYLSKANKFCELLTRLPELSRLSTLGKDILKTRQSQGDLPQYSLLSELLKGDSVVQT